MWVQLWVLNTLTKMRNSLRKIIKEEIGDFGWAEGIPEAKPLISSDGMSMTLSYTNVKKLLNTIGQDINLDVKEYFYKSMPVKSLSGKLKINVYFYKLTSNGVPFWRVLGRSGDYGWGYSYINKRNLFGKRIRQQVFNKIKKELS